MSGFSIHFEVSCQFQREMNVTLYQWKLHCNPCSHEYKTEVLQMSECTNNGWKDEK